MRNLLLFLPPELAILLFAAGGIATIVGARAVANQLMVTGLALLLLPALLAPLFDALPAWLLVLLMVFFAFGLLRAVFELLIGKNSTDHMVGILAADVVRHAVMAPFRIIGWTVRRLMRNR